MSRQLSRPGKTVHFCPGAVGGAEWNSPAYDPRTNLILVGEVDWCDTVRPQDVNQLRSVALGQPWAGMATLEPVLTCLAKNKPYGGTLGRMGLRRRRRHRCLEVAREVQLPDRRRRDSDGRRRRVLLGDLGGNFYALDAANGEKLWGQQLGGAIAGGVITYIANGAQKVAVASGFTMLAWPTQIVTAKVEVLGLDSASARQ